MFLLFFHFPSLIFYQTSPTILKRYQIQLGLFPENKESSQFSWICQVIDLHWIKASFSLSEMAKRREQFDEIKFSRFLSFVTFFVLSL